MAGELPPVIAILTANTSQFTAKMGEAGATIKGLQAEGGRNLKALGAAGGVAFAAIGAAAIGAGVYSVLAASKFDAAMETIHTQAGASQAEVDKMKGAVLSLAGKTAEAPDALADALYHVESNGIRGATALSVLKAAAEGAQIGHADLTDTTNALTAAINSGIPGVENFGQAMGALNATVGSGDMKMQDLNDAFGTGIVVIAKQFGNSLNDVGSALATFGDNNIRGAKAGTELRMAIMDLAEQSAAGKKALAGIGIKAGQLGADMRKGGLGAALVDLKSHLTAAGDTGSKVGQVLTEAFTKKASAPLAILIDQLPRFQSKQDMIRKGAGQFGNDWTATTKTFQFQMHQLGAEVEALAIKFGEWLIPKIEAVARVVEKVVRWFGKHREAAKILGIAILGALVPALAVFTGELIASSIALIESPIGLITLAAAALAVGIFELATHWKQVWSDIKKWAEDAWKFLDGIWQGIDRDVRNWFGDVEQVFKNVWKSITDAVTGAAKDVAKWFSQMWSDATSFAARIWHDVAKFFSNMWRDVTGFVTQMWHDVAGFFARMWTDVEAAVYSGILTVVRFFENLPSLVINAIGGLLGDMYNFGVNLIRRLIDGIGSMAGSVGSAIGNVISGAVNSIPGASSVAHLFGFSDGGVVPGPAGRAMLAVVHGGEYVIPPSIVQGGYEPGPSLPDLGVAGRTAPGSASPVLQLGSTGPLIIQINGRVLAQAAGDDIRAWLLQKNRQVATLGFT